ncbi:hypothetical protein GG851_27525 [Bordetella petrii]|nr:hypothetical protein [Bordetella petrii]
MTSIAQRRAHVRRLKKARRIHWGRELNAQELGKAVSTPTPCSCWMCGNPRKFLGQQTRQEIRQRAFAAVVE